MTRAVYITGLGLATPLGRTPLETWGRLLESHFISDAARVPQLPGRRGLRVDRLAHHVTDQALGEAAWNASDVRDAALVVGTSRGPVEAWLPAQSLVLSPQSCRTPEYDSSSLIPDSRAGESPSDSHWGMSSIAARLAQEAGFDSGPRLTFSSACASGIHALIRAALLLSHGETDRALVVGVDSSLHPMFLESFRRLGVLAPEGFGCRPFDEHRSGFVASEAAAAVCLEARAEDGVEKRGIARIDRFALAGDAFHLTGSNPLGKTLSQILTNVIDGRPIDLLHAHGTGTTLNDPIELAALDRAASTLPRPPHVYSHKGALGHSLGASGLVAVVLNCLAHRHGIIPPNIRTEHPLPAKRVLLDRACVQRPIRRSLACAAGFGGSIAAVSLV